VSWKLSRTVLRGAAGGNADRLLDQKLDRKTKQPFNHSSNALERLRLSIDSRRSQFAWIVFRKVVEMVPALVSAARVMAEAVQVINRRGSGGGGKARTGVVMR
jgi:hypothetical protein